MALMLGRLEMDIDSCIDAFTKLSEEVFTPKRSRANIFGRLADTLKVKGAYDAEALASAVKEFVQQSDNDRDAPLLSPKKRCKV